MSNVSLQLLLLRTKRVTQIQLRLLATYDAKWLAAAIAAVGITSCCTATYNLSGQQYTLCGQTGAVDRGSSSHMQWANSKNTAVQQVALPGRYILNWLRELQLLLFSLSLTGVTINSAAAMAGVCCS